MPLFIDQIGHSVQIDPMPQRIISTVPSLTELLFDFGLDDRIVGVTKFCVHPQATCKTKACIGGTKQLDIVQIKELAPDLIIANKEENTEADIRTLQALFPVWTSDIIDLASSYSMMRAMGQILQCEELANHLVDQIQCEFSTIEVPKRRRALYFIWNKPWMVAGRDTFIHHMMDAAGFDNAAASLPDGRYPEVNLEQIQALGAEIILLSSEPFPFQAKHREKMALLLPLSEVFLVDGEMFSWYGSRMALAGSYFKALTR
jgi:ABC-type Fe3+-hydroxamate transport system substrate-binding protein